MIDDPLRQVIGGAAGLTLLGWLARASIRMWSRNRVDGARDRAEIDVISILREEVRALRSLNSDLARERNDSVSKVGALEERVMHMQASIELLRTQVTHLQESLNATRKPQR